MSQRWKEVANLSTELLTKLTSFYSETFPIEIRDCFTDWIEAQPWEQIDENNQSHMCYAIQLLQGLLELTRNKAKIMRTFEPTLQNIQNKYTANPLCFVRDMKSCLAFEDHLISLSNNNHTASPDESDTASDFEQITKEFETLNTYALNVSSLMKELQKKQQDFAILLKDLPFVKEHFTSEAEGINQRISDVENLKSESLGSEEIQTIIALQKEGDELRTDREFMNTHLANCIKDIIELIQKIVNLLQQSYAEMHNLQEKLLSEDLPAWKLKQQMACNGGELPAGDLTIIQKRCECHANYISRNIQHTINLKEILDLLPLETGSTAILQELQKKLPKRLLDLITRSFIVEQQPPQVLRKENKFEATAKFLVGKAFHTQTSLPKVTAFLINERQAKTIHASKEKSSKLACGELLNNELPVECLQCGSLSAKFKNLVLKQYKRESKKTGQRIAEEKYCIVFECKVQIGIYKLKRPLRVLSVPVIITTNISQECQALATISWDHQFSHQNRVLFEVPDSVPWLFMANLLNIKFQHETGRGLTSGNINYLASKLFGPADDYSGYNITFDLFCKVNMKDNNFSFWEWIYHIMRLTKEHLLKPWKQGYIAGFVSKSEAESLLDRAQTGTFLCRFSDTKLGGISVAERKFNDVSHTEPFTAKDLHIRSLSQLVNDQERWTRLYPDKTKEETFGKYANEDLQQQSEPTRYEKFIWVIKLKREEVEREVADQDCLEALRELIDGTDVASFVGLSSDVDMEPQAS